MVGKEYRSGKGRDVLDMLMGEKTRRQLRGKEEKKCNIKKLGKRKKGNEQNEKEKREKNIRE